MDKGTEKGNASGYDIHYDFYCEICKEAGQCLEAEGFCVECNDYLCAECSTHHRHTRFTINHEVLDEQSMPKEKPLTQGKCCRVIETKCKTHRGRSVEYHCQDHNALGCDRCIRSNHLTCSNIVYISEISEQYEQSQDYQIFEKKMDDIAKYSCHVIQESCDNIRKAETICEQNVKAVRQRREDINKLLDEQENNLIRQAETVKNDNLTSLKSLESKAKSISEEVKKMKMKMKGLQSSKKVCQLFINMKELSCEIQSLESSLGETVNRNVFKHHDLESNSKLLELCRDDNAFGKFYLRHSYPVCSIKRNLDKIVAECISDIDLRSKDKNAQYNLAGSAVLSRNKMVVVDIGNATVSLIDTQLNKLIYDLKGLKIPWSVCAISQTEAAVTVRGDHKVVFLEVTDVLKIDREISVNGECCGIGNIRDMLVVSFTDPSAVQIIDLQGNVVKEIVNDGDGNKLFRNPLNICFNRNGEAIYISDFSAHKVTMLSFNGEIQSEYYDRDLVKPYTMCVDQDGNLYVASFRSKTVHVLTSNCSKIRILLGEVDGLKEGVFSVSHCHKSDRLFVGMWNNCKIKIFQLK